MNQKMAMVGLRGLALAPITENTSLAYKSGAAKALPFVGSMTRAPKEKKQDVYYDDELYGQIHRTLGEDVEIRLGEISLETLAELGLGAFDPLTGVFEGRFSPKPGVYSLRCIGETLGGLPLYFNWRVFDLTGIRFDNFATMGENVKVCEVIITGVFKKPGLASLAEWAILRADGENQAVCDAFMGNGESLPLGGFIRAMTELSELPGQLADACFPGERAADLIKLLRQPDRALIRRAAENALRAAPHLIVRLAAVLCEADERRLMDDPAIGADGLIELLEAWLEVNRLGDFPQAARNLIRQFRAANDPPKTGSGSSGSSPKD